jgi:hypothetical protein
LAPDWVEGVAGFGDTVADALRDLAHSFAEHCYELRGNAVAIEAAGSLVKVRAFPGQSPSEVLMTLAQVIEDRGYKESDFPEPDSNWLANEERVIPPKHQKN